MRGNPAPWTPGVPGLSRDWSNGRALNDAGSADPVFSHAGQKNRANCTARPILRPPAATGWAASRKAVALEARGLRQSVQWTFGFHPHRSTVWGSARGASKTLLTYTAIFPSPRDA